MSRKDKRHRTKEQAKRRRKKLAARRDDSPRWASVVAQAGQLIERGRWDEAGEKLEEYERAHPGQPDILQLLLEVYQQQRDYEPYCRTCRRLLELCPREPILYLMLAAGYLHTARFASALRAFRRFLELSPNDPLAEGARESVAALEPAVDDLLRNLPFAGSEAVELASLHEEVLACLASEDCARAIEVGEQLLARCPQYLPNMNNLGEAYFRASRSDRAFEFSERVLQIEPDNFQALANQARYLLLCGRTDEADSTCERLRSVRSNSPDFWSKQAETLSYFGDDQGVLRALQEAEDTGSTKRRTPDIAVLYHLAAVAAARQGDPRRAGRYWRTALEIMPGFQLAEENLRDSRLPAAERQGPWPFSLDYWIRQETAEQLSAALERSARRNDDAAVERAMQRFIAGHPEIASLVPVLLDRGHQPARDLAYRIARLLPTPEMLAALREFCLSQRGPDAMRLETANYLCYENVLPPAAVRIWLAGSWKEVELLGFEITDQPVGPVHSRQVDDWAYDGIQALKNGNGAVAEELFRKCLERESDAPDLWNNLAMACEIQGKTDEMHQLTRLVRERWPDYFFGLINAANLATVAGEYEQAESYLTPLRHRRRLHLTEFTALAVSYVQLLYRSGKVDGAKSWLEMWERVAPDDPRLRQFEFVRSKRPIRSLAKLLLGKWR